MAWIPCRYQITLIGFWANMLSTAHRACLGVAIVAMVKPQYNNDNGTHGPDECEEFVSNTTITKAPPSTKGDFDWSPALQGVVLGSLFFGYILPQIIAGRLCEIYSARLVGGFMVIAELLSFLLPIAAFQGIGYFIAIRIIQGISLAVATPTIHGLLGTWAPTQERSRIIAINYMGSVAGVVIGMPVTGLLIEHFGWPYVFHFWGFNGIICFFGWYWLVYDSPLVHPRVSQKEKDYILANQTAVIKLHKQRSPWKQILTSAPVWSIVVAHFAYNWAHYMLITCTPIYMKNILHFDLQENSVISMLPYLAKWFASAPFSTTADWLVKTERMSIERTRKLFNTIGFIGGAAVLFLMTLIKCDPWTIVVLLILSMALSSGVYSGWHVNHIDISPNYAGTLYGLTNTIGTIPGMLAPFLIGILTSKQNTQAQWNIAFDITAILFVLAAIVFILFASGEVQQWDNPDKHSETNSIRSDNKVQIEYGSKDKF